MEKSEQMRFYLIMLNTIQGLEDDIVSNKAPEEALDLVNELYEICKSDYNVKYGDVDIIE